MWQASSPKGKGAGGTEQRGSGRISGSIHLMRITVEVRKTAADGIQTEATQPLKARVLLYDLSPIGVGLFCSAPIPPSQKITLAFSAPATIFIEGKVVYCQEIVTDSHIISETPFSFRVGVQFHFATDEDATAMKKFCDDLATSQAA